MRTESLPKINDTLPTPDQGHSEGRKQDKYQRAYNISYSNCRKLKTERNSSKKLVGDSFVTGEQEEFRGSSFQKSCQQEEDKAKWLKKLKGKDINL